MEGKWFCGTMESLVKPALRAQIYNRRMPRRIIFVPVALFLLTAAAAAVAQVRPRPAPGPAKPAANAPFKTPMSAAEMSHKQAVVETSLARSSSTCGRSLRPITSVTS
jgi:hypothetical protein